MVVKQYFMRLILFVFSLLLCVSFEYQKERDFSLWFKKQLYELSIEYNK